MTESRTCPTCRTPLPADAPDGGCPRCLLMAGLQSHAGTGGPAAGAPSPSDLAGYFPALEIVELIGQGGMGIVYKARQKGLDRVVALKVLAPEMAGDAAFSDRFAREAQALARLSHPNIVGVHEFGETEGLYYFVMEYVDGMNLREALHGGHLQAEQALAIVPQICDALQYAHDNGVVHRDIKPENVLIGADGRVKIADFGLAKLLSPQAAEFTLTRAGQVMGTPHYMAPEQIEAPTTVDHRADIYSLGVVFYEMLTGELPIGRFQPPSRRVQLDVRLDDVVLRALEKAPDRRYQQVSEVKTRVNGLGTPAPVPLPVAAEDGARSRISKLALWGFLCFPLSVLAVVGIAIVASGLAASGARGVTIPILMLATTVSGAASLVGIGLSISGWVAVSRSNGRLHGKAFAILGTFLPLLCLPLGVGWMTLAPRPAVAPGVMTYPIEVSADDVLLEEVEPLVEGAFAIVFADMMTLDEAVRLMAPADVARLRAMTAAERGRLDARDELGFPYIDPESLPVPIVEYDLVAVEPHGDGTATATLRAGRHGLRFPITNVGGRWKFALGSVERFEVTR